MEAIAIIGGILAFIVLYFFFGMVIKLAWGWLPLVVGLLIGIPIAILGGWTGAVIGILIIIVSVLGTDTWQGSSIFLTVEESIEKKFYLND